MKIKNKIIDKNIRLILLLLVGFILSSLKLMSQCYPDRHSTNWYDGWTSCTTRDNPNQLRDQSHWILYNFGKQEALGKVKIWNTNDPASLENGIRSAYIDASNDGVEWQEIGQFDFPMAEGDPVYQGFDGPDLGGQEFQYVLITATDNHGGDCYGLSEVRFYLTKTSSQLTSTVESFNFCLSAQVFPNPFEHNPTIEIHSNCNGPVTYSIKDITGRTISTQILSNFSGEYIEKLEMNQLPAGTYIMEISGKDFRDRLKLVKT